MKNFTIFLLSFWNVFQFCALFGIRTRTGPKPPWDETYVDKLRKDLLTNYDKYARPGEHYDVTNVQIGITVTYVETDELNSTISVSSWLKLFWTDAKLKWNTSDYGGIKEVKMADHEIWQPDIVLYNSALGSETVTRYGNPYATVHSNGYVYWVPPSKFNAICEFDLYYWPFDTQHCYLKFASWTHSGKQIKLGLLLNEKNLSVDLTLYYATTPWEISVTGKVYEKIYKCCPDPFYTAQFDLMLARKSSSYIAVVVIPILVVISSILIQFSLPTNSGQRIILGCCTAVMVSMILTYFINRVSHMGNNSPWIVTFYCTCLYMVSISMAECIFVLLLLKAEQNQSLPWIIKKHLQGKLGKFLLLENCVSEYYTTIQRETEEEMKDYHLSEYENDVIIKSTSKGLIHQEWEIFAIALDRIFLLIYCFAFFVLILCYII